MASWIVDKVKGFASNILNNMKSALGIHSPSTLFRDQVGKNIALGVGEGFEDNISKVYRQMKSAVDFETQKLSAKLSTTAMFDKVININSSVKGNVEMDGNKVGRLVTPVVSKTLRTAGVQI
jgi:phage-related protein